jgi:hypothetical protein
MSLLIVPLLYPDLAELLNLSDLQRTPIRQASNGSFRIGEPFDLCASGEAITPSRRFFGTNLIALTCISGPLTTTNQPGFSLPRAFHTG